MNSREKVLNALQHIPGPVPTDFGGTNVSGIHCSVVAGLREFYGLENRPVSIIDPYQMLGTIDEDLCQAMGIDVRPMLNPYDIFGIKHEGLKEFRTNWGQTVLVPQNFNTTEDNGRVYVYAEGDTSYSPAAVMPQGGYFFDSIIRQEEIDDDSLNVDDNLQEFSPIGEDVLDFFRGKNNEYKDRDVFIIGSIGGTAIGDIALVPGTMLKAPKGIRDIEEWYISTCIRQDFLHEIFTKQTDIALKNLARVNEAAGGLFDAVFICGTDFGTQTSTFCSAETYRSLYMPYYIKINNWIHENTSWKTFKHCCGAVENFFPLFIESGFDIINPVQWTAQGMQKELLKERHGDKLVFWGGGVDTQKTLPFGTPETVKKEVLNTCRVLSDNGGFVFNTIHNIQAKTPIENVVAMIDAVKEFNTGR